MKPVTPSLLLNAIIAAALGAALIINAAAMVIKAFRKSGE